VIHFGKNNPKQVYMMLNSIWQLESQFRKAITEGFLPSVAEQAVISRKPNTFDIAEMILRRQQYKPFS